MFSSVLFIMDALQQIVQDIEEENAKNKVRAVDVFRSMLNQPELIAVNSLQRTDIRTSSNFSTFTINLPRPVLQAETMQLVNANIPQCVPSIPDTATTFWYYRVSEYSGKVPNTENLFFVRLLPSYYKPEFISNSQNYGQNKTFNSYPELAQELQLACSNDLGYYNVGANTIAGYDFRYLPNEISLPYNASMNRFQCIGTNAQLQLAYKQWSSATTYAIDDVVFQGTTTYKSLQSGNLNNNPSTQPTWWVQVNGEIVAPYDAATPYPANRYVAFNNLLYKSIQPVLNVSPPNTTYWQLIAEEQQVNYRYLVTGYNDPNVVALQNSAYRTWNQYALYETGTIVAYNGSFWEANYQNQNTPPALPAWSPTFIPPLIVGLNACSREADMVETGAIGLRYPFPEGIPGQPFNPSPKRLLNSILGFVWNGVFNPQDLQTIVQAPYINFIPTEITDLYNRLRPVPLYTTAVALGLGSQQSTLTQTFTAEGYANLVYSSILSIYATFIGGSSVDTQDDTGLLAQGTMNCGNLGISFFQPAINNPLKVMTGDLYSITFELKDEFGEPYVLTNNAVVSLVMKVTYKKSTPIRINELE